MNRRVLLLGLAIVIPIVAILVANLGRNPHRVNSPLIGRPAPQFTLRDVDTGAEMTLASLRGKPVVVNFWATWCIPCHEEHKVLVAGARRAGADVQFVGVVFEDTKENILAFLRANGSAYPTLVDNGGRTAIAYGVYGVPETFFVDRTGKIIHKHEGPLTPDALSEQLVKLAGS